MRLIIIVSLCFVCGFGLSSQTKNPKVKTPSGVFEGSLLTTRLGKTIYSFRGIRYGIAPVGELRFKDPVPIKSYEGVYDATEDGPLCPQPEFYGTSSEDCLILNVYTTQLPQKCNNTKRPVIVLLHAGGFYSAGSASYWAGPQYFMDQDIVLVTFNYRLASLGFLSTGDKYAPGNYGIKDQVVLLKWVERNIEAFGGDHNSVTLFGYSAGAWSTILHMLSPMSQGLFHKAILMGGGGPLGPYSSKTNQLEIAKKQARLLGCPDDSSENIVKCLRTVPVEKFNNAFDQFREFGNDPILVWSPVIEGNFSKNRFLTEEPMRQVLDGRFQKIPVIIGQTQDEVGYRAFNVINNKTLLDEMNEDFERVAPISFVYERSTAQSRKVSRAVKKFYLNDKPIDQSQLENLAKLYADGVIGFGVHRATKLLAEFNTQPVYSYCFTFKASYSHFYQPGTNNTVPWGVVHHDDLMYLFYIEKVFPYFTKDSPEPEIQMIDKLTTILANFAKTGTPIPEPIKKLDNVRWRPFNLHDENYLDIGEKLIVKKKLYEQRFKLWEELYPLSLYRT